MEITKREIIVTIAITLILMGLGLLIGTLIENSINENNELYFKSLKIDNDETQFKYAINTNIGYVLARGKIVAKNGVSIDDIEGQYFSIRKVTEEYTMHTRQVPHTVKVGNTTTTYYTTEIYWTWDYRGEENFNTEKFEFLGVEFNYGTINFNNEEYKETKDGGYHIRYKYYIIPFEFNGCLFTYIKDNEITENQFFYNSDIQSIINEKENDVKFSLTIFWITWIILILFIDFGYISLENRYLED